MTSFVFYHLLFFGLTFYYLIPDICASDKYLHSKLKKSHQIHKISRERHHKNDVEKFSKYMVDIVDMSCSESLSHPRIANAQLVKYIQQEISYRKKIYGRPHRRKFLTAIYKCDPGYELPKDHTGKLYCSNKSWIGKTPVCLKRKVQDKNIQSDQKPLEEDEDGEDVYDYNEEDYDYDKETEENEDNYDDENYDDDEDYEGENYDDEDYEENDKEIDRKKHKETQLPNEDKTPEFSTNEVFDSFTEGLSITFAKEGKYYNKVEINYPTIKHEINETTTAESPTLDKVLTTTETSSSDENLGHNEDIQYNSVTHFPSTTTGPPTVNNEDDILTTPETNRYFEDIIKEGGKELKEDTELIKETRGSDASRDPHEESSTEGNYDDYKYTYDDNGDYEDENYEDGSYEDEYDQETMATTVKSPKVTTTLEADAKIPLSTLETIIEEQIPTTQLPTISMTNQDYDKTENSIITNNSELVKNSEIDTQAENIAPTENSHKEKVDISTERDIVMTTDSITTLGATVSTVNPYEGRTEVSEIPFVKLILKATHDEEISLPNTYSAEGNIAMITDYSNVAGSTDSTINPYEGRTEVSEIPFVKRIINLTYDGEIGSPNTDLTTTFGAYPEVDETTINYTTYSESSDKEYKVEHTTENFVVRNEDNFLSTKESNEISKINCPSGFIPDINGTCVDIDECAGNHSCSQFCENVPGFQLTEDGKCEDIDECAKENICKHKCLNHPGSFECTCEEGYVLAEDNITCRDFNECLYDNLNDCSHTCINEEGAYHCECRQGYLLLDDAVTCMDRDECSWDNGNCSHLCFNTEGSFICSCEDEWVLSTDNKTCLQEDNCSINNGGCTHICTVKDGEVACLCPENYLLIGKTCIAVNLCSINNGNCSHYCEFVEGKVNCLCPEMHKLLNQTHCIEENSCLEANGGCSHACDFVNYTVICSCPETHTLGNKTHCFEKNPCSEDNGGCSHKCNFKNEQVYCSCPENYYLEGKTCYASDPCLENNGGCSHYCYSDQNSSVICECPEFFELKNKTCYQMDLCQIKNGLCSHICTFDGSKTICSCPEDYVLMNKTTCEKYNLCEENNGGCSHICEIVADRVKCSCPVNYNLLDSKTCVLLDPCMENNGGCSHTCKNINGVPMCSCPKNLSLKNKTTCIQTNLCFTDNGGCSHECVSEGDKVYCLCPDGYELEGKICHKIDPCSINNGDCSHECVFEADEVRCLCPEGYELINKTCHNDSTSCFVNNGGCSHECVSESDNIYCLCPEDYELRGKTCFRKTHSCEVNNGGCSHECVFEANTIYCLCPPGYKLRGQTCHKILNPCEIDNGGCSHICKHENNRTVCECPEEYEIANRTTCILKNPCDIDNGNCSYVCINVRGKPVCSCPAGYEFSYLSKSCKSKDACARNNGNCSHHCKNIRGKELCSCPSGYIIRPDRHTCKEINECRQNRGGCSHGCKNLPGSYMCTCPIGFKLDSDNKTCVDINECLVSNGNCEMYCTNREGGYNCFCEPGYRLRSNKKSCEIIRSDVCTTLVAPANGNVWCKSTGTYHEEGSECYVQCNFGYKLVGSSVKYCHSGTWGYERSRCVSSVCPKLRMVNNGWFTPISCTFGFNQPGDTCRVHCKRGYRPNPNFETLTCNEKFIWNPIASHEELYNACVRDVSNSTYIKCPSSGSLNFDLPPGQNQIQVRIPRPETNVDWDRYVESNPAWGKGLETFLTAGRTFLVFTVTDPATNLKADSCRLIISVFDKERPAVVGCPNDIEGTLSYGESSTLIYWNEPEFTDNVGVINVHKSREPGTQFGPGLHQITYEASDESGNKAYCHFSVTIKDELGTRVSKSIDTWSTQSRPARYRAVLICPSGVHYMSQPPDYYDSSLSKESGCYWSHVRVTQHSYSYRIPQKVIRSPSMLPSYQRSPSNYFSWYK